MTYVLTCDRTPLQARIVELLTECGGDALCPCGVDGDVVPVLAERLPQGARIPDSIRLIGGGA